MGDIGRSDQRAAKIFEHGADPAVMGLDAASAADCLHRRQMVRLKGFDARKASLRTIEPRVSAFRGLALLGGHTRNCAANPHDAMHTLVEKTGARANGLPLPFFANTPEDREILPAPRDVRELLDMSNTAGLKLFGIGMTVEGPQPVASGMINPREIAEIQTVGAVRWRLARVARALALGRGQPCRRFSTSCSGLPSGSATQATRDRPSNQSWGGDKPGAPPASRAAYAPSVSSAHSTISIQRPSPDGCKPW